MQSIMIKSNREYPVNSSPPPLDVPIATRLTAGPQGWGSGVYRARGGVGGGGWWVELSYYRFSESSSGCGDKRNVGRSLCCHQACLKCRLTQRLLPHATLLLVSAGGDCFRVVGMKYFNIIVMKNQEKTFVFFKFVCFNQAMANCSPNYFGQLDLICIH